MIFLMKKSILFLSMLLLFSTIVYADIDLVISGVATTGYPNAKVYHIIIKNKGSDALVYDDIFYLCLWSDSADWCVKTIPILLEDYTKDGKLKPDQEIIVDVVVMSHWISYRYDLITEVKVDFHSGRSDKIEESIEFNNEFELEGMKDKSTVPVNYNKIVFDDEISKCKDDVGTHRDYCQDDFTVAHYIGSYDGCTESLYGCTSGYQECDNGICVWKQTECWADNDCEDNNPSTTEYCTGSFPKTCYYERTKLCMNDDTYCPSNCTFANDNDCDECFTDYDCNDRQGKTKDICSGEPKRCSYTIITECITGDLYCPDGCNYETDDDCHQCLKDEECDDGIVCTVNDCIGWPKRCKFIKVDGCELDDECVELGTRNNKEFCAPTNFFLPQKEKGKRCTYDYECSTNYCHDSKCESKNIFLIIISWFQKLFPA